MLGASPSPLWRFQAEPASLLTTSTQPPLSAEQPLLDLLNGMRKPFGLTVRKRANACQDIVRSDDFAVLLRIASVLLIHVVRLTDSRKYFNETCVRDATYAFI